MLAQLELYKERFNGRKENKSTLKDQIATLKDTVELLKSQLQDKDYILIQAVKPLFREIYGLFLS